jgi:hypothetical protein
MEAGVVRMEVHVECYSGRKAEERPIRFRLGNQTFLVEEILDRWYGPDCSFFKLRADDGNVYILRQNQPQGTWDLESFRGVRG